MRKFSVFAVALLSIALIGTALVRAEDPPAGATTQPAKSGRAKLIKPYSDLKNLTDEQLAKLEEIHTKYLDEQRELKRKHDADMMAVLTDEQKAELKQADHSGSRGRRSDSGKPKDADKKD